MPRARARIFFWKFTKSEPHTLRYIYTVLYRYVGFFNLTTLVLVCLPVGRNLSIFAQMFSWRQSRQIYFHIVVQVRQVSVN